jgi:hypothetical protein
MMRGRPARDGGSTRAGQAALREKGDWTNITALERGAGRGCGVTQPETCPSIIGLIPFVVTEPDIRRRRAGRRCDETH